MPRFSKHFRINAPQAELDFVDVSTDYDTKVYVDPYAIEIRNDVWSGQCSELVRTFFTEVLDALRAGDDLRAQNLMSHLHEPAETFLGVSRDEPKGRGVGAIQAAQLVRQIRKSKAFKTGVLSDLSEVALFVERIGRDKISDLTTNIIRAKLVEYTNQRCDLYGIDATPSGTEHADRYHMIAMHILTLCFYPDLIQPHKEWEGLQGSTHPSRADIRVKYFWMRERYNKMVDEVQRPLSNKYAEDREPTELDAVYLALKKIGRAT